MKKATFKMILMTISIFLLAATGNLKNQSIQDTWDTR